MVFYPCIIQMGFVCAIFAQESESTRTQNSQTASGSALFRKGKPRARGGKDPLAQPMGGVSLLNSLREVLYGKAEELLTSRCTNLLHQQTRGVSRSLWCSGRSSGAPQKCPIHWRFAEAADSLALRSGRPIQILNRLTGT